MLQLVSYLGFPLCSVPSMAFTELLQCQSFVELKESHQNPVLGHLLLQLSPNSSLSPSSSGVSEWHSNCYPVPHPQQQSELVLSPLSQRFLGASSSSDIHGQGYYQAFLDWVKTLSACSISVPQTGRLVSVIPLTATIFLKGP